MKVKKEKLAPRLYRSGLVVSGLTMLSRVLGMGRDICIAYFFGSGTATDAFILSFRIPNLFRRLFAEGAFSQAFVPVLTEYKQNKNHEAVRNLVNRTMGSLGMVLLIITIIGMVLSETLVSVFAPGYLYSGAEEKLKLSAELLTLTFPYLFLISMTALAGSVLNAYGRFAAPAFSPALLNLSLIGSAVFLRDRFSEPVFALAWGVLIAGVAQLCWQMPSLFKINLIPRPKPGFRDSGVKRVGFLMLPAIFGASVSQINILLDTVLASFLETGSLSWLYYSDRLLELPLALFGITIATIILPRLSSDHLKESNHDFSSTLDWALRMIFLFGVPASASLLVLSDELIATLFFQGAMTARDVSMAGASLAAYGAGLLGHMMVKVLAPGYFARQDMVSPVRFGVFAMVANMVMNLLFIWHFQHVGLAMATSISAFLNALLLYFGLRKSGLITFFTLGNFLFFLRLSVATLLMIFLISYLNPPYDWWLEAGPYFRVVMMVGICFSGIASYFLFLVLSGFKLKSMLK
ncbi:MAG: murein biosynthesis integral membrane protein MurJ [Gammaproteobacteria bacterium]|nr:murein biosynthesis integral membrane protein MurJ [Gammaproteobacteria bacterium]